MRLRTLCLSDMRQGGLAAVDITAAVVASYLAVQRYIGLD